MVFSVEGVDDMEIVEFRDTFNNGESETGGFAFFVVGLVETGKKAILVKGGAIRAVGERDSGGLYANSDASLVGGVYHGIFQQIRDQYMGQRFVHAYLTNGCLFHFDLQVFMFVYFLKVFDQFFDDRVEFNFFHFVELTVLDAGEE